MDQSFNRKQSEKFEYLFGTYAGNFTDRVTKEVNGTFMLDVPKFADYLAKKDMEYDRATGTFKGERMSVIQYIRLKYGNSAVSLVNDLIDSNFDITVYGNN